MIIEFHVFIFETKTKNVNNAINFIFQNRLKIFFSLFWVSEFYKKKSMKIENDFFLVRGFH
jgi:hypothetical protein